MRKILLPVLCFCLLALPAMAADISKFQLPNDLTLEQAEKVLSMALVKAVKEGIPVNIAVVDAGGNLKTFARMDGAFLGSIDLAIKKASTARQFNMSTATLGSVSQPGQPLYGIEVSNNGLIIFGGGELLKNKNGLIVGAIGVSGGTVEEDVNIAKAGVAALK